MSEPAHRRRTRRARRPRLLAPAPAAPPAAALRALTSTTVRRAAAAGTPGGALLAGHLSGLTSGPVPAVAAGALLGYAGLLTLAWTLAAAAVLLRGTCSWARAAHRRRALRRRGGRAPSAR